MWQADGPAPAEWHEKFTGRPERNALFSGRIHLEQNAVQLPEACARIRSERSSLAIADFRSAIERRLNESQINRFRSL